MAESFNFQGQGQLYFVPTIAGNAGPTLAELAAGTVLGDNALSFTLPARTPNTITATPVTADEEHTLPALPGTTNGEVVMRRGDTSSAASYTLWNTMKALEGTAGYFVTVPTGKAVTPAAGAVCDVYPSTVNLVANVDMPPGAPATWKIAFAHNGAFRENKLLLANP